jgi:hypothetical protein
MMRVSHVGCNACNAAHTNRATRDVTFGPLCITPRIATVMKGPTLLKSTHVIP